MEKTTVVFYMEETEALAVFPYDREKSGFACYSIIGEHSTASVEYVKGLRKATKKEYTALAKVLTERGYNLKIK